MGSALKADVSLTPRRNVSSHGFAERGPVEDGQYELSIPLRQCSLDFGHIASTVVLYFQILSYVFAARTIHPGAKEHEPRPPKRHV